MQAHSFPRVCQIIIRLDSTCSSVTPCNASILRSTSGSASLLHAPVGSFLALYIVCGVVDADAPATRVRRTAPISTRYPPGEKNNYASRQLRALEEG